MPLAIVIVKVYKTEMNWAKDEAEKRRRLAVLTDPENQEQTIRALAWHVCGGFEKEDGSFAEPMRLQEICKTNNWPYMDLLQWLSASPDRYRRVFGPKAIIEQEEARQIVDETKGAESTAVIASAKLRAEDRWRSMRANLPKHFNESSAPDPGAILDGLEAVLERISQKRRKKALEAQGDTRVVSEQ